MKTSKNRSGTTVLDKSRGRARSTASRSSTLRSRAGGKRGRSSGRSR